MYSTARATLATTRLRPALGPSAVIAPTDDDVRIQAIEHTVRKEIVLHKLLHEIFLPDTVVRDTARLVPSLAFHLAS